MNKRKETYEETFYPECETCPRCVNPIMKKLLDEDSDEFEDLRDSAMDLVYIDPPDEDWDGDCSYIIGLLKKNHPGFTEEAYELAAEEANQYYWDLQFDE